jgi:hypothetical protein
MASADHARRPKGLPKTGGRRPGSLNKRTIALREFIAAGAPPELATKPPQQKPLAFLLNAMNNNELPIATRIDAAKAAAPYLHHRLGLVDSTGRDQQLNITILRFSDLEPLDRRAEKVIEHNSTEPSTSH